MNKKQVTVHVREVRKLEFDPMTDDRKLEDEVERIRANVNWHKGDSVETLLAAYERWSGTIKVGWTIRDRDLGPQSEGEPTPAEMRAIYDRIEELVTSAFHQRVTIWIDGEDKPPVDVFLEATDMDIEIDDGPVNGMLSDLRSALEDAV